MSDLRALLREARDWLCPHTEASAMYKKLNGARREWCCACSNYLRSDEDSTLIDRIDAALADKELNDRSTDRDEKSASEAQHPVLDADDPGVG